LNKKLRALNQIEVVSMYCLWIWC